ncbi:diaminopropionate ammonia-lyase, partial [Pelagibacterales bacterium SAG-MED43]|nr:diaminopropionate ammonia-lyase [Pelagibacterales bacterium SAG-MED43]
CVSLPDDDIAKTMKLLGNASFSDKKIIAGENSAPGVISLITICEDEKIKKNLNLDKYSNILLIGCEGDTDQEMYQKLINQ